jgi:hypothetical protein
MENPSLNHPGQRGAGNRKARAKPVGFMIKIDRRSIRSAKNGFNRLELMAVVAAVVVLAILLILGSAVMKEDSVPTRCRANLAQITKAFLLYAQDNHGLLPDCSLRNRHFYGPSWPWDMNTNLVQDLMERGVARQALYCPANPGMNDPSHWDFPNVTSTPNRIVGYGFLLYGSREVPRAFWCRDVQGGDGQPPSRKELGMDATMSMNGDYTDVRGLLKDRTSHLKGNTPLGGNISFEDGHSEWRDFKDMQQRFSTGANVIWVF